MKSKSRIYYLVNERPYLQYNFGSSITELNHMKMLSQFSHVFYNNNLFKPNKKIIKYKKIGKPRKNYNYYFIRRSYKYFNQVPKNKKKILFALNYKPKLWKKASALYVPTYTWKKMLKNPPKRLHKDYKLFNYPLKMPKINKKIIVIPQSVDLRFQNLKNHPVTINYRNQFTNNNSNDENILVIGHLSKISSTSDPRILIELLKKIEEKTNKKIILVLGTNQKNIYNNKNIIVKHFPYKHMPYVISACDLTFDCVNRPRANIAGNMHIREFICCNIPCILPDYDSNKEAFGNNYPLYYKPPYKVGRVTSQKQIEELMINFILEKEEKYKHENIINVLKRQSVKLRYNYVFKIVKKQLKNI